MEKLRGHAPSDSMEVGDSQDPAGDIETVVSECKFSMKLHMADSAWKQVRAFGRTFGSDGSSRPHRVLQTSLEKLPRCH